MSEPRDVIIIGSGPSGYSAAIHAARAALQPVVFEGSVTAGGALVNTTEVENFPGFPDGVQGPALMAAMRYQAERFGAELVTDDVVGVDLAGDVKTVRTDTQTYTARTVILATARATRSSASPARTNCPAVASRGARPATVSSSGTRPSPWSVAATPPSKRPRS